MNTIRSCTFSAFADLTSHDSVRILDGESEMQRHTLTIGSTGAVLDLYLTPGSLEVLRDAITTHLGGS